MRNEQYSSVSGQLESANSGLEHLLSSELPDDELVAVIPDVHHANQRADSNYCLATDVSRPPLQNIDACSYFGAISNKIGPLSSHSAVSDAAESSISDKITNAALVLQSLRHACHSLIDDPSGFIAQCRLRNFNAEYQNLYDSVPTDNLQIKKREDDLKRVEHDFGQFARIVSEVIILQQQFDLSDPDRYMIPIIGGDKVGGVAGGEKFVYGNVLFKFARDWQNIYGNAKRHISMEFNFDS
jgi:hypothetical protein